MIWIKQRIFRWKRSWKQFLYTAKFKVIICKHFIKKCLAGRNFFLLFISFFLIATSTLSTIVSIFAIDTGDLQQVNKGLDYFVPFRRVSRISQFWWPNQFFALSPGRVKRSVGGGWENEELYFDDSRIGKDLVPIREEDISCDRGKVVIAKNPEDFLWHQYDYRASDSFKNSLYGQVLKKNANLRLSKKDRARGLKIQRRMQHMFSVLIGRRIINSLNERIKVEKINWNHEKRKKNFKDYLVEVLNYQENNLSGQLIDYEIGKSEGKLAELFPDVQSEKSNLEFLKGSGRWTRIKGKDESIRLTSIDDNFGAVESGYEFDFFYFPLLVEAAAYVMDFDVKYYSDFFFKYYFSSSYVAVRVILVDDANEANFYNVSDSRYYHLLQGTLPVLKNEILLTDRSKLENKSREEDFYLGERKKKMYVSGIIKDDFINFSRTSLDFSYSLDSDNVYVNRSFFYDDRIVDLLNDVKPREQYFYFINQLMGEDELKKQISLVNVYLQVDKFSFNSTYMNMFKGNFVSLPQYDLLSNYYSYLVKKKKKAFNPNLFLPRRSTNMDQVRKFENIRLLFAVVSILLTLFLFSFSSFVIYRVVKREIRQRKKDLFVLSAVLAFSLKDSVILLTGVYLISFFPSYILSVIFSHFFARYAVKHMYELWIIDDKVHVYFLTDVIFFFISMGVIFLLILLIVRKILSLRDKG